MCGRRLHGGSADVHADLARRRAGRSRGGPGPWSRRVAGSRRKLRRVSWRVHRPASAVAIAATPSPRPVKPRPSVVVAETLTGAPRARGQRRLRLEPRGGEPRAVADDLHGDVADPRSRRRRATPDASRSPRNTSPCAPANRGSAVPNTLPMSPRPAAESSASQMAWLTASPSLCPASPGSPGQ